MASTAVESTEAKRAGRRRVAGKAAGAALALGVLLGPLLGTSETSHAAGPADSSAVARGRYLAHHVAMCVQCHTPRRADGTLDETRLFQGGRVPVEQPFPNWSWALDAPAIAGMVLLPEEDEISVLTKGHRTNGVAPRPPMPPFRLSEEDARAIIAYLRTVPSEAAIEENHAPP